MAFVKKKGGIGLIFIVLFVLIVMMNNHLERDGRIKDTGFTTDSQNLASNNEVVSGTRKSGLYKGEIVVDGLTRYFQYFIPSDLGLETPLPIVFHGAGRGSDPYTSGTEMMTITKGRFEELAEQKKFIVVYPTGVNSQWNDGREKTKETTGNANDIAFTKALIDWFQAEFQTTEVYATGFSNGGHMVNGLGCETSYLSGIAPVSANLSAEQSKNCDLHIPVLMIFGITDPIAPYEGGDVRRGEVISIPDTFDRFLSENACSGFSESSYSTHINLKVGNNCRNQTIFYEIENGGHTWPGGMQYLSERLVGLASQEMNAADEIVSFLDL